jgi:hypothetical protein
MIKSVNISHQLSFSIVGLFFLSHFACNGEIDYKDCKPLLKTHFLKKGIEI